ncbi:MAG: flavodoxin family protein, partial [Stomatobaculum longum]
MKILLINGSPKGAKSNSLRLAHSFLDGIREHESERERAVEVEELHLNTLQIAPCKGCFACWKQTPGTCCMEDDMQTVIEGLLSANLVIWSFPLYYYSVPGPLKNLIDRQLPMSLPFMCESRDGNGSGGHPSRYDRSGIRHVLISTCGFYSAEGNYDSVTRMFDHVLGQGKYTSIFCGQGELFRVKELSARTDAYLAAVRQAGREYAGGRIREETETK